MVPMLQSAMLSPSPSLCVPPSLSLPRHLQQNGCSTSTLLRLKTPCKSSCLPNKFAVRSKISLHDVAEVAQNKVLIAAGVSAAIGQLLKPLSFSVLYGESFDLKSTIRSGGFPSTHSAAVVATATSLSFERGFSDSIFGLSVVYAGLIMYDAQGVRREVGKHAKVMNEVLLETPSTMESSVDVPSQMGKALPVNSARIGKVMSVEEGLELPMPGSSGIRTGQVLSVEEGYYTQSTLSSSGKVMDGVQSISEVAGESRSRLTESVGHTEVEVTAGAVLGLLVSILVYSLM